MSSNVNQSNDIHIPTQEILKVIFIILFFIFLYFLKDILFILLFAIIIASAVSPFSNWLDEKKFPRLLGIILLYLCFFIIGIFVGIISFASIIVISFYLSYMKGGVEGFIKAIIPSQYEVSFLNIWRKAERKIGRWVQGQLLLALIVGLTVYVGLSLIGIKFALILGIAAMILELVPIVGPVLSAIPAILLAFTQGPSLGLWVILFYVAVQQLENHILVPLILGKTLGLNPVIVIVAILIGAKLAGILGMILSVPVAVILGEIIEGIAQQRAHNGES